MKFNKHIFSIMKEIELDISKEDALIRVRNNVYKKDGNASEYICDFRGDVTDTVITLSEYGQRTSTILTANIFEKDKQSIVLEIEAYTMNFTIIFLCVLILLVIILSHRFVISLVAVVFFVLALYTFRQEQRRIIERFCKIFGNGK